MTGVARNFGFYTGCADYVPKKMWRNMLALPGYINRGCINTLFIIKFESI